MKKKIRKIYIDSKNDLIISEGFLDVEGSIEFVMKELANNYLKKHSCNYDNWDEIHIVKDKKL